MIKTAKRGAAAFRAVTTAVPLDYRSTEYGRFDPSG
jgi:hypothetical protein